MIIESAGDRTATGQSMLAARADSLGQRRRLDSPGQGLAQLGRDGTIRVAQRIGRPDRVIYTLRVQLRTGDSALRSERASGARHLVTSVPSAGLGPASLDQTGRSWAVR